MVDEANDTNALLDIPSAMNAVLPLAVVRSEDDTSMLPLKAPLMCKLDPWLDSAVDATVNAAAEAPLKHRLQLSLQPAMPAVSIVLKPDTRTVSDVAEPTTTRLRLTAVSVADDATVIPLAGLPTDDTTRLP